VLFLVETHRDASLQPINQDKVILSAEDPKEIVEMFKPFDNKKGMELERTSI